MDAMPRRGSEKEDSMLEIRHLSKVYRTRGGADVHALDDVSLRFEETGMVFLLGKSGSGKSTLLNLCGGLDTPDEGEIVIKGRSSKDFTQADFDSYRNTFVGFVFQEYNILDEFSVEENIALALELQGKGRDKARVREILEQVELAEFARRKPNTLSGGQKQRVAIARALVKNPEIIMADEPTGALDSNTGKQVFDTLKKLSESKLVLVVSHDREFAEIYGDRIVELKDGKVISDVVKTKIAATPSGDNLAFIGTDTITIKNGAAITDADMAQIRAFLASSGGNVLISNGKKEISDFKKAARIDEDGARESFRDTSDADIAARDYAPEDAKLIRSKLPARHAIRIGASSMKVKPFRLFFTVLLSFIAFTLFGLFSTLTFYNEKDVMYETYLDSGYSTVNVAKRYHYENVNYVDGVEEDRWEPYRPGVTRFTPDELAAWREDYGDALGLFSYVGNEYSSQSFRIDNAGQLSSSYYSTTLRAFGAVDPASSYWQGKLLTDTDLSALGEDDVVISSYMFDSLKEAGLEDADGNRVTLETANDIVGKTLIIPSDRSSSVPLTVRGVFEEALPAELDKLKEQTSAQADTEALTERLQQELTYGLYCVALVSDAFYDAHESEFYIEPNDEYVDYGFASLQESVWMYYTDTDPDGGLVVKGEINSWDVAAYSDSMRNRPEEVYFFDGPKTALAPGEILVPFELLSNVLWNIQSYEETVFSSGEHTAEEEEAFRQYLDSIQVAMDLLRYGRYQNSDGKYVSASDEEIADALDLATGLFEKYDGFVDEEYGSQLSLPSEISLRLESSAPENPYDTYTLAGFYYGKMGEQNGGPFLSQEDFDALVQYAGYPEEIEQGYSETVEETRYVEPEQARYNEIVFPFPGGAALRTLIDGSEIRAEDDSFYAMISPIADQLFAVNSTIQTLEQVFLWVGVVMAVFSMLLLFNFISVSITNKKKEIGILRAVGARSADVFKIFFSESAIISAICFVLAMVASFVVCGILNNSLGGTLGASIFVFGPLSWLVMLGIAVVTSVIATFLPVYGIAKKRPVESIRAL